MEVINDALQVSIPWSPSVLSGSVCQTLRYYTSQWEVPLSLVGHQASVTPKSVDLLKRFQGMISLHLAWAVGEVSI